MGAVTRWLRCGDPPGPRPPPTSGARFASLWGASALLAWQEAHRREYGLRRCQASSAAGVRAGRLRHGCRPMRARSCG
eukprot:1011655-Pyramimonas_sp.AAC.1